MYLTSFLLCELRLFSNKELQVYGVPHFTRSKKLSMSDPLKHLVMYHAVLHSIPLNSIGIFFENVFNFSWPRLQSSLERCLSGSNPEVALFV